MESAEFTNEALSELQVRPVERNEEARYQEHPAQLDLARLDRQLKAKDS